MSHSGILKVLLVEDDEDDFIIARDYLSEIPWHRFALDWVKTFEAGLAAMVRNQHEVVLVDYRLGEKSGIELLRLAIEKGCQAPIILLTGMGEHQIDLEAMEAGAADYLVKADLRAQPLERSIRFALERKRAAAQAAFEQARLAAFGAEVGLALTRRDPLEAILERCAKAMTQYLNAALAQILVSDGRQQGLDARGTAGPIHDRKGAQPALTAVTLDKAGLAQGKSILIRQLAGDARCRDQEWVKREGVVSYAACPLILEEKLVGVMSLFSRQPLTDQINQEMASVANGIALCIERKLAEVAMLDLEAQFRHAQKLESVGQLAAGIAHDFNNLLTVIQGYADSLGQRCGGDEVAAKAVRQIGDASQRASALTRQLLIFSRKQVLQPKVLDLNGVLQNLTSMLQRLLGEDIALQTDCPANLSRLEADAGMLEQVVMNLAVNSRDAMPKGGQLLIRTSDAEIDQEYVRRQPDSRTGRFVCLTVADTGCGMDAKTRERIFEPFFSTKPVGKGTGLGLATVYGIVTQHQGWIEVASEPNAGTTFKIFFPAYLKTVEPEVEPLGRAEKVRGGKETILVVEDEPVLRELVGRMLNQFQYRVLEAGSGPEALEVWAQQQGKIDLLLTDMVMPEGLTGRDLANQFKQCKPSLKVIYTSGYSPDIVGEDSGRNGTVFLSKPYLPAQLAQAVRRSLDAPPKRAPEAVLG